MQIHSFSISSLSPLFSLFFKSYWYADFTSLNKFNSTNSRSDSLERCDMESLKVFSYSLMGKFSNRRVWLNDLHIWNRWRMISDTRTSSNSQFVRVGQPIELFMRITISFFSFHLFDWKRTDDLRLIPTWFRADRQRPLCADLQHGEEPLVSEHGGREKSSICLWMLILRSSLLHLPWTWRFLRYWTLLLRSYFRIRFNVPDHWTVFLVGAKHCHRFRGDILLVNIWCLILRRKNWLIRIWVLYGWFQSRRMNSFAVLHDHSSSIQFLLPPITRAERQLLKQSPVKSSLHIKGVLRQRAEKGINPNHDCGHFQVNAIHLGVFLLTRPTNSSRLMWKNWKRWIRLDLYCLCISGNSTNRTNLLV